jgi:uncharacterized protein (TIGR02246 family)
MSSPTPAQHPAGIHARFEAAFNAFDGDALADLYEPDAVMVAAPGNPPRKGSAAIRAAMEAYFAARPVIRVRTASCVEGPDGLALLECDWIMTGAAADGPFEMSGRSVEVVRRQADGSWRYVIDNPFAGDK